MLYIIGNPWKVDTWHLNALCRTCNCSTYRERKRYIHGNEDNNMTTVPILHLMHSKKFVEKSIMMPSSNWEGCPAVLIGNGNWEGRPAVFICNPLPINTAGQPSQF